MIAYRNGGLVVLDDGSSLLHDGPIARFDGIYSRRINKESDIGIDWKAYAIQELLAPIK